MIETIYQAPELPSMKIQAPTCEEVMEAFKKTTMFATMYAPYQPPTDQDAVEEATEWLAMETTIEYTPYKAPIDDMAVNNVTDWLKHEMMNKPVKKTPTPKPKRVRKKMTEEQREKYLKYQKEYYKKNAEKQKAEKMMNYYIKKINN